MKNYEQDREQLVKQFIESGLALGIETATFPGGDLGLFEGYLKDDVIFKYSLLDGFPWSYAVQDFLLKKIFVNSQGTYIDVGANIGLITIPVAERGQIKCYAFEPEPNNYKLLCRNVLAHDVESLIETYAIALFSKKTTLQFELCSRNYGDHRVKPHQASEFKEQYNEGDRQLISINAEKLDDVLEVRQLASPIVLKVDIQGSEVQFFRGAEKSLDFVDYLIVEYWPYGILYCGDTLESFLEVVRQFPFVACVGLVDRVRSIAVELQPVQEAIETIRTAVDPNNIDPDREINLVCSRTPTFPADLI
jgi:FkbM family methyltransferase